MSAEVPELKTRKPTGKPPWPMVLLAGGEKCGKSWSAAAFSASDLVGRTFYIEVGEHYADEYGAIPGARYEIVEHDGSYRDIGRKIWAATRQPRIDGKPNAIVVDSMTLLWDMLSDEAQATANARKKKGPDGEAQITMDLWNAAKRRWNDILGLLRTHDGPVILTARLEQVAVMAANGQPTTEKALKVKAEKNLPYEVDVIVRIPEPRKFEITGLRSTRFQLEPGAALPAPDFSVDELLRKLGLDEDGATAPRSVTPLQAAELVEVAPQREQPSAPREDEWTQPSPAEPISDAQKRMLGALITKKVGRLTDEQRHGALSSAVGRQITSANQLTKAEASRVIDGLSKRPDLPEAPVPLSVRQSESPETIAAAQGLVPSTQAAIQEQVEDHLLDGIQSAPDPDALVKAWSAVEAAQGRGEIGSADVLSLRGAYDVRAHELMARHGVAA